MKYRLVLCILIFKILSLHSEELCVGSWNIQGNGGPFNEKELIEHCEILIKDKNLDILALQEVKVPLKKIPNNDTYKERVGNDFLDHLVNQLSVSTGGVWKFLSSCSYSIRKNVEDYAYCNAGLDNAIIYNSNRLNIESLHSGYPFYLNDFHKSEYKMNMNNTMVVKVEQRFDSSKYFYLINKHMPFISKTKGWGPWFRDIKILEKMYDLLDNSKMKIILGDFNANKDSFYDKSGLYLFQNSFIECSDRTTLSYKIKTKEYNYGYSYDHFIVNNICKDKIMKAPVRYTSEKSSYGTVKFGPKSIQLKDYAYKLSDHFPIYFSFDF